MNSKYHVDYLSRAVYPKTAAHALQSMQMAAAFARQTGDTQLYVRYLTEPLSQILSQYGIDGSPLEIRSLHGERLPAALRSYYGTAQVFNFAAAALIGLDRKRDHTAEKRRILFVRSEKDYPYLSRYRRRLPWLKDWFFIYEAHDIAGLGPQESPEDGGERSKAGRQQDLLGDLGNFDLVECVTQALASDLEQWSSGRIQPRVVRHASAMPRAAQPAKARAGAGPIILGYIGAIDTYRGVDKLLQAMRFLPDNYHLRLVGRIPELSDGGRLPDWLSGPLNDPEICRRIELVPAVPVHQVAQEIDRCDILLQPASNHIFTLNYASPLKSFDYMMRGKPIVAADVPCHRELFQDEVNAVLYRLDDVEHLAARIQFLAERPELMETVARNAWEQSADYTYDARARRILDLVGELWGRRRGI